MEQTSGLTGECSRLWDRHSKAKVGREGGREGGDSCFNSLIGGKGKVVYKMF